MARGGKVPSLPSRSGRRARRRILEGSRRACCKRYQRWASGTRRRVILLASAPRSAAPAADALRFRSRGRRDRGAWRPRAAMTACGFSPHHGICRAPAPRGALRLALGATEHLSCGATGPSASPRRGPRAASSPAPHRPRSRRRRVRARRRGVRARRRGVRARQPQSPSAPPRVEARAEPRGECARCGPSWASSRRPSAKPDSARAERSPEPPRHPWRARPLALALASREMAKKFSPRALRRQAADSICEPNRTRRST